MSGGTYSLKSTPSDIFLRNFFRAALFTLRVFARSLMKENRRRNTFRAWGSNPGSSFNKPRQLQVEEVSNDYSKR